MIDTLLSAFPSLPNVLAFALAALALNLTPGADMAFVASTAARSDAHLGVLAAVGIFAGCCIHIAAAVFGLSALLKTSQTAFAVLKWLGAAYLVFLAWRLALAPSHEAQADVPNQMSTQASRQITGAAACRAFKDGALINILNPKVGLFFLAFLPQFVSAHSGSVSAQILALGLWFNLSGLVVNMGVAFLSARMAQRMRALPQIKRLIRWFAAAAMASLAARLALSRPS